MEVTTDTRYKFTIEANGSTYTFTMIAATEEIARERLAKDLESAAVQLRTGF